MAKSKSWTTHKKSLRDHLSVAFHRKWMFLIPCVLSTGLLIAGTYALPKKYRAEALVRRMDQTAISAAAQGMQIDSERTSLAVIREEILVPKQLVNVLKRSEVIKVLDDPNLQRALGQEWNSMTTQTELTELDKLQDSLATLRKQISITVKAKQGGVETIEIAVEDRNPLRARVLANAICANYKEYHERVLEMATTEAIKFPQQQRDTAKADLQKVENELAMFQTEKHQDLPEAKLAVLSRRAELDLQIPKTEIGLRDVDRRLAATEASLKAEPRKTMQKVDASESPEATALKTRITDLETALTSMLLSMTESHPDVRRVRGELAAARNQLQQMQKSTDTSHDVEVDNPQWESLTAEWKKLNEQKARSSTELDSLKAERDLLDAQIKNFSPEAFRYNEMKRTQGALAAKYDYYVRLVDETQARAILEKQKQGTTVEVVSLALLPHTPSFPPSPLIVMILALAAGIGTGIGFVMLGEMADHSFKTVEDAGEYLDLPILGTVGTIHPAVNALKVWLTRAAFVLVILALVASATLSYYYQDPLREFVKSLLG